MDKNIGIKIKWPVVGKYKVSFRFGETPDWYIKVFGYPHNGIDIACPVLTPVVATDKGRVVFSDDIPDLNGKGLILEHTWGMSLYWHLQSLSATLGNYVEKEALIANSGATGYVTGPHLHFGIKVFGVEVPGMRGWCDPLKYIDNESMDPQEPYPQNRYYMVRPGDCLWNIANKFYGNGLEWRRIYESNKDKISNPNLIRPFIKLLIP
jgi:murein DD-endopeptidase MepM/ murein hydrolase activator NlpD